VQHAPLFPDADSGLLSPRRQLSIPAILRVSLDAIIAVGTLGAIALFVGEAFDGPYLILSLIVFSLTFPAPLYNSASCSALARRVILNWLVVASILLLFGFATRYLWLFPGHMVFAWILTVPVLVFLAHALVLHVVPKLIAMQGLERSALIVGANELGARLLAQIRGAPLLGIRVAGVFDDRGPERHAAMDGAPLLGPFAQLADHARRQRADIIYLALPMSSQPRIVNLLNQLRDTTASIYFVPDIFIADLIQARVDSVNGIPVVAVCETPFFGINGLMKTASDYLIAVAALTVLSPVMVLTALAVKLSSPGPVLFKQRRYGVDGKEILVYKFRTMIVLEDGAAVRQATKDDDRVTRVGRFLRRTSLDELPQFINVLQGRMSVVGPRPHAVSHNEMYRKLIDGYMVRHKVKPGVTGWAQVNGLRGETDTVDKMQRRIEYDLAYLRNWSIQLDVFIVLKSALLLLGDRKAH
jgi:putative colanic acid biosysnthesis UDP-glucose lipid carrier transferase